MTPPLSDHFNGKTFFQPHHRGSGRWRDLWRWKMTAKPAPWPAHVSLVPQPPPPSPRDSTVVATWIGHASFLLQTAHANILIDPVFAERASPFQWIGPRRAHPPGISFANLPRIDVVLLSHDHYDHCDTETLRRLAKAYAPVFVAPLRHRDLLSGAGATKIVELDWWDAHALESGISVTLTPSKHWSNRLGTPVNHRLWGGFYLNIGLRRAWFVGDSGYDAELFREVRRRCEAPDLAWVPIGAYEPRWFMAPMHMNPVEAVQLHREVGARVSVGMHWGTFQLTDEGREEPVKELEVARKAAGVGAEAFRVLEPGESVVVGGFS